MRDSFCMVGKLLKMMKKSYLWKQFKYMLALPLLAVSLGTFAHSACSSSFLGNTDAVEEAGSSGKKEFRLIGKVVNEGKMPIPGITVWVKGTSKGTMTDGDGKFVLHVKSGDELQFSHVVYRTQNFVVKDDTPLVVKMVEYIRNMDEIVVVGCAPERGEIIEVTGRAYDFETGFSLCPAIFRADGEFLAFTEEDGNFKVMAEVGKALRFIGAGSASWVVVKDAAPILIDMKIPDDLEPIQWYDKKKAEKKMKAEQRELNKEQKKLRKELRAIPEESSMAGEETIFQVVEQAPEFQGGMDECLKFLARNLKYPLESQQLGICGKIIVRFMVREDGQISDIEVSDYEENLQKEVFRVMNMMPKWNPGKQRGKAVSVKYVIPIVFKLEAPIPGVM